MLYLKKISPDDGIEIYNMLQEIELNDNGFHNKAKGMNFKEFKLWLEKEYGRDNGELEDWMVPQTSYWLYDGEKPVGYGRLRHCLNENLKENSGHIGYAIRKSERNKGYGTKILALLLSECEKLKIKEVQIGANSDNSPQIKLL